MTPTSFLTATLAALLPLVAATAAASAELRIIQPWIRVPPPGAQTAAGYLTVQNTGARADRLLGAGSAFARSVELHTMSMQASVMRMRSAEDGLAVPAHGRLTLAPGGAHLMFVGPRAPLHPGEKVRVTLRFARAGQTPVVFTAETDTPPLR